MLAADGTAAATSRPRMHVPLRGAQLVPRPVYNTATAAPAVATTAAAGDSGGSCFHPSIRFCFFSCIRALRSGVAFVVSRRSCCWSFQGCGPPPTATASLSTTHYRPTDRPTIRVYIRTFTLSCCLVSFAPTSHTTPYSRRRHALSHPTRHFRHVQRKSR